MRTPLPMIPFSSDDIRSRHQEEYYEDKRSKFRAKICSLDRNEGAAQRGLNQQEEPSITAYLHRKQDWTTRLKNLARNVQQVARQRLGISNANQFDRA